MDDAPKGQQNPPTPASESPPIPLQDQKVIAETEKVRLEVNKLAVEMASLSSLRRMEFLKSVGTFTTAVVAMAGLFLTLRSQLVLQQVESSRTIDQAYESALKQYGEASSTSRLAAVAALEPYMTSRFSEYNKPVASLFVSALGIEKDLEVRDAVQAALVRNPSPTSIALLREKNVRLQGQLLDALKFDPGTLDYWERYERVAPNLQGLADALESNAKVIIDSINAIFVRDGVVRNLNLSNVVFMFPRFGISSDGASIGWKPNPALTFVSGIVLENVSFEGAKLSWLEFKGCRFIRVQMDNARLVRTRFVDCQLRDTSLSSFVWTVEGPSGPLGPEASFGDGPHFIRTEIDTKTFFPRDTDLLSPTDHVAFAMTDSHWSLGSASADLNARLKIERADQKTDPVSLVAGRGSIKAIAIPKGRRD